MPELCEQLLVCAVAQEEPHGFGARKERDGGVCSSGTAPGKDSAWGMLSSGGVSALDAVAQLLS